MNADGVATAERFCLLALCLTLAGCVSIRSDDAAQFSVARSFVAAASKDVSLIEDESERGACMYELASLQAMLGDVHAATAIAAACPGSNRKSETYGYIAEIQTALGDINGARSTLRLAKEAALAGLTPTEQDRSYVYIESVAIKQARLGDLSQAAETLSHVKNNDSRELTQVTLASFHTEHDAREIISSIVDPFKRDLAIEDLVQRKASSGDTVGAWETANSIADAGLKAEAFIGIAEVEVHKGNTNEAERAYAEAIAVVERSRLKEPRDTLMPDEPNPAEGDRELQKVVEGLVRMGKIDDAKANLLLIRHPVTRAEALVEISLAQSRAGKRKQARATQEEAVQLRGEVSADYHYMQELSAALARAGDLPEALNTASMLRPPGEPKDHAFEEIVDVLIEQNDIDKAKSVIRYIPDPRWNATSLARVALAQGSSGSANAAKSTFAEARAMAASAAAKNRESYTWTRSSVYHYIAMKQSEAGQFEEITRWVPLLPDALDRCESWLGAAFPIAHRHYRELNERIEQEH
jgi:tetratricopeptide (TPR) repeat protein